MFLIRRIFDDSLPIDREAITQVQNIMRSQFGSLPEREIQKLPRQLRNPLKFRFRSILFIADDQRGRVRGFALLMHAPDLGFCYLDFISVDPRKSSGGIGGALYERVREQAQSLDVVGIFFECLPDEPHLCHDPIMIKENKARLRFYERFGARPIINTAYETPLSPEHDCPPYLVYDPLETHNPLSREKARQVVRAILERKYGSSCPPGYIDMVEGSFHDDPVQLRKPQYVKASPQPLRFPAVSTDQTILLVVNDQHTIHHVHERGYVESPVRVGSILRGLEDLHLFMKLTPKHFPESLLKEVHDSQFVEYLKRVCTRVDPGKSIYPYVFPIRNATRPPKELPVRAGYFCIDTFTPLNRNAYMAAKRAVDCALTAAQSILRGYRLAYALVRPPGHHAERHAFGGFCYFNSAAAAAQYLSSYGKVVVLDIDYHHGNGTQDIFYNRPDVLTLSIHGHPHIAYPYFSGFRDERGSGAGEGFNINYPLPENINGELHRRTLTKAIKRIIKFQPSFLIVALGFDTAKADPTGTWSLEASDFEINGFMIGSLRIPTIVVQEGGYRTRSLGNNARHFFQGLSAGENQHPDQSHLLGTKVEIPGAS
jgi:acetoin utilization deacetylase AcuC-like enzyme/GNAT superfamily N-acetyltransferase